MSDTAPMAGPRRGIRSRLRGGGRLTAMFSIVPSPFVVEMIALAGFDAVIIDMEHGPVALGDMAALVMAAECGGAAAIVRVPTCDPHVIGAVLDIGAAAVLVPQVQTAAQARRAVAGARYAPEGERGVNPWTRGARYGLVPDWTVVSNREVAVMVMIEGREGLANLDEIMAVPGLDAIFLGPVDMASSLGVAGDPEHPSVVAAIGNACARAGARGMGVGVFARTPEIANRWIAGGVSFVAVSEDTATILDAMKAVRAGIFNERQTG